MPNETQYNSKLANLPSPAIALTAITYLLLGFLETLEGTFVPPLLYFFALGVLALYLMPYVLGCPTDASRCVNTAMTFVYCRCRRLDEIS